MTPANRANSHSKAAPQWLIYLGAAVSLLVLALQFAEPLGSDEVWTLAAVRHSFSEILDILRADVHPPLYFLILKLWTLLSGTSDFALQAFSALCFGLSQFVLYRFLSHRGQPIAAVFAALFLLNPLGLLVSHFARMYSLLLLLQLLSLLMWWKLSEAEGKADRTAWLFLVVNILGSFTHIWFFFHLAALFAVSVFYPLHPRRRAVLLSLPLALLPYAVLWAPVLLAQIRLSAEAGAWLPTPGLADLFDTLLLHLVLAVPVLVGLALYWLSQKALPPWPRQAVALGAWLLLFLAIPFALSFAKPIYYQRFTIAALPVFALLAGYSLPPTQRGLAITATFTLAIVIALFGVFQFRNQPACNSRWSAKFLEQRLQSGDRIVFTSLARAPVQHYSARVASQSQSFPAEIDAHPGYEPNYDRLNKGGALAVAAGDTALNLASQGVRRIWLVHGFRPLVSETFSKSLALSYKKIHSESFQCPATPCYHNQLDLYVLQP